MIGNGWRECGSTHRAPGERPLTKPVKPDLGRVQETLLIPLLARARETERRRGLLRDPRAVELVRRLDYDFEKWEGGRSLKGAMLRARMFDRYVEDFLVTHPRGTVVEIGCGLDTRFDRVDNGRVRWFDLDLPDAVALRRRFFDDEPRRTMVAASVLDSAWMNAVKATGGPWMFVAEAVLSTSTRRTPGAPSSRSRSVFPAPGSPSTPRGPGWSTRRTRTTRCGTSRGRAGSAGSATTRARSSRGARTFGSPRRRRSSTPTATSWIECR